MKRRLIPICRHCGCPLLLLRRSNGKVEQRRICAQCQEARQPELTEQKKRKSEQVKAWKAANKERIRATEKAWKDANKDRPSVNRIKLLIEDYALVTQARDAFYGRRPDRKPNDV